MNSVFYRKYSVFTEKLIEHISDLTLLEIDPLLLNISRTDIVK